MDRNRIRYFFVAVAMFIMGYLARTNNEALWRELSFVLISAGSYFIFSIMFKKSASWVLIIINLGLHYSLHSLRMFSWTFYNNIYDSEIGKFIIGGPLEYKMFFFVFLGTCGGAALELAMRQFNKIGMG